MKIFEQLLNEIPNLQDQIDLFNSLVHKEEHLTIKYKKYLIFAASITCKNKELYKLMEEKVGFLTKEEKELILTATSRMAVTNPYFMSRNIQNIHAGGTLESIALRPFPELKISDEISYHYACIAISMINGVYVCFNSHLNSLKVASQNDQALDQALRLISSVHNLNQLIFNKEIL